MEIDRRGLPGALAWATSALVLAAPMARGEPALVLLDVSTAGGEAPRPDARARLVLDASQGKDPELFQYRSADELRASGSGQFSEAGLRRIREKSGPGRLVVVDLREESHGFVDGRAVSLKGEMNAANAGKDDDQVQRDEGTWLAELLRSGDVVAVREAKEEGGGDEVVRLTPARVASERELCEAYGASYVRLPVRDHHAPDDGDVDRFVSLVRSLPAAAWVHLHCKGGKGRTTTFMAMLDMLRNPGSLSAEEVGRRQAALGGSDLFEAETAPAKVVTARQRSDFLHRFHAYCRAIADGDASSWSTWSARRE